jgi:D-alanine-D-alanine ligase
MSQRSCDGLLAVLEQHYTEVGVTIVNNVSDLEDLAATDPDLVFLGMKFVLQNERGSHDPAKIWITDYLDGHDIAYTGSGQAAHELEADKALAKQRVLAAGLRTSPFYVIKQDQRQFGHNSSLKFPLFVKPANRGGGLGIDSQSVVHDFDGLCSKVSSIASKLRADALVEEYLPGREFSVALLRAGYTGELQAMPIELSAEPDKDGRRLLSGQTKSLNSEQVTIITDVVLKAKVNQLAADAFYALGARDYGRIDIRLDAAGTPHFLEANLLPSLISGYGSFPKACVLNRQLDYEAMILQIVRLAVNRRHIGIAQASSRAARSGLVELPQVFAG